MPAQIAAETTNSILLATAGRPLHLLHHNELFDQLVSSESRWNDAIWYFDNPTPGAVRASSSIYWSWSLPRGGTLFDPKNAGLLDWLRRLVWSCYAAPGDGAGRLKPGTLRNISAALRFFVDWFTAYPLRAPADLTAERLEAYIDHVRRDLADDDESGTGASVNQVVRRLQLPVTIWQQRFALERAGISMMPEPPYGGLKLFALAKRIATRAAGQWLPLPDEVAVPVLNRALWFLGTPAQDILALDAALVAARDWRGTNWRGDGASVGARNKRQHRAARSFEFSDPEADAEPWHAPLRGTRSNRKLILAVQSAAVLVIQGTTGMRISEICGLQAGINPNNALPANVHIEPSLSGLFEIFVLTTKLAKTEDTPRDARWTLGSRTRGANDLPPAVSALLVMNRLLDRFRDLCASGDLWINFPNRGTPRIAATVGKVTAPRLLNSVRNFVEEWVDLTDLPNQSQRRTFDDDLVPYRETKGRCIKTHQLRKLFANFALRVDGRLLPALQQHFHHVSQAMTDGGYRMSHPMLLREIDDQRGQQMALMALDIARGPTNHLAGRNGERLEALIRADLAPKILGKTAAEAWDLASAWVPDMNLRAFFEPHGMCGALSASEMLCHVEGGSEQSARWRPQLTPNYGTRDPPMCAGCPSFAISRLHRPFWEDRYVDYAVSINSIEALGDYDPEGPIWAMRGRLKQALAICKRLGSDVADLDQRVVYRIQKVRDAASQKQG